MTDFACGIYTLSVITPFDGLYYPKGIYCIGVGIFTRLKIKFIKYMWLEDLKDKMMWLSLLINIPYDIV